MSDKARTYFSLALGFYRERRYDQALAACRSALKQAPGDADVLNLQGAVLLAQGRAADAIASLSTAVEARPGYLDALNNLGLALEQCGRLDDALGVFEQVLAVVPDHGNALPHALFMRQRLCHDWSGLADLVARLRAGIADGTLGAIIPFPLVALPGLTGADLLTVAARYMLRNHAAVFERPPLAGAGKAHDGRLRVGYLSHDFRAHPTSELAVEVLEAHDRRRIEVTAYSYGAEDRSALRARILGCCEHVRDLQTLSDDDAARAIAADEVDVLVDLTGHIARGRHGILARRPAPVQVNWLGYPGTLGHVRLADYLIGDPVVTPVEYAGDFAETLALLPDCYQPNVGLAPRSTTPTRADQGLPDQGLVFCCFNQSFKFTPDVFDLWCQILRDVPQSTLWLLDPGHSTAERNILAEAAGRGISRTRIRFARKLSREAHLARLPLADLALDTFPCTSHTTGSDAIRAGVPLITRTGSTFASRVAASLLHTAGMDELIAESPDAFVALAVELGRDADRLAALRHRLAERSAASPLFKPARFARNLERLYERMWADHLAGRRELITLTGDESPDR